MHKETKAERINRILWADKKDLSFAELIERDELNAKYFGTPQLSSKQKENLRNRLNHDIHRRDPGENTK